MKKALSSVLLPVLLGVVASCKPAPPEDFGTVMIELQQSPGQETDPYLGTKFITAFLDYGPDCLLPFYVEEHPEYQIDGVEGAPVFEEWQTDLLCGGGPTGEYSKTIPKCTVKSIEQQIDTQMAQDTARLLIEYDLASDKVRGTHLPFGPLPTEELAGCRPIVTLTGGSVQGKDAQGDRIWQIASFENPSARVGQGASIQIFVERTDP